MSQSSQGGTGRRDGSPAPLSARDRAVVELVARFRQLSAAHIHTTLFADCASHTPCDRTLKRLCERGFLTRLARPVGGDGGGSSQYVYQLGRSGWRLLGRTGAYWAARTVNLHALAVADCFVLLQLAERDNHLAVLRFDVEPASHRTVDNILLTPDAYAEVGVVARRMRFSLFLEIDRGTEHARVIAEKCSRYWHGFQQWTDEHFPYVMFVVPDASRREQVSRITAGGPAPASALFRVVELTTFAEDIQRNL